VEIQETGTNVPKTITKWVSDESPAHSGGEPIKVDAALQFVPKNTNPKEFKQLQQQIKENRRGGGVSAGPQSHILEGVSWDEARQLQEAAEQRSGGDQVVLVGAASKGIIQRNYQHNATVYKTPYAKNPFDQVTDEDLEEYKRFVDQKSRGTSVETEVAPQAQPALQHASSPEHAERVELPSDGEEADVSRSSAAPGDLTANGDETDTGHMSTVSHTDQEDVSTSEASKKDKKKKKGLRTPSFLKKKKDKKKDKKEEAAK